MTRGRTAPAASAARTLVCAGLDFPTSVELDDRGNLYVAESGLPFGGAGRGGRVLRLDRNGGATCLRDGLRSPVNGLTWHAGALYISEGGEPGRISRLTPEGDWTCVLDGLPGGGNYHTNEVAFDSDGWMYFGQGALTNSGVVGPDALDLAWLRRLPHPHDVPGLDIELTGENAVTDACEEYPAAVTGSFVPYGTAVRAGERIPGSLPCTSAVMRCRPDGTSLELVAWGLRNPYGLGFIPDGRLLAIDLGVNDRGSRPVGNGYDCLFEVERGWWYGWPDHAGGRPVTHPDLAPVRGPAPRPLIANAAELPPLRQPLIRFPVHSAPVKFAVPEQGWNGCIHVAFFGDELPMTGPAGPRAGRCVARVDTRDGSVHPLELGELSRPIDVAFDPSGEDLFVLDFGSFEMRTRTDLDAQPGSGKLWRVSL